jgi:putative DNA methylase
MGVKLMATVAQGDRRRVYLSPTIEMAAVAKTVQPLDVADTDLPAKALGFRVQEYGMTRWCDLFTSRQLVALATLSDLVQEARSRVNQDAIAAGLPRDGQDTDTNSSICAMTHADAVATFLGFGVDRTANYCSTVCTWHSGVKYETVTSTFARQAIPMTWDFAESNPFSDSSGNWARGIKWLARVIDDLPTLVVGITAQQDATSGSHTQCAVVSTDPPLLRQHRLR